MTKMKVSIESLVKSKESIFFLNFTEELLLNAHKIS